MADQYRKPYLDADTFISWIRNEHRAGVQCKPIIDLIHLEAENGRYKIGISTLIIAEVHKVRSMPQLSSDLDDLFISFFQRTFFDVIEVDRDIAESANRFCRPYNLRPNDAIHLASAVRLGCDVLLSWDSDYQSVNRTDISCEQPEIRGQPHLPEDTHGS